MRLMPCTCGRKHIEHWGNFQMSYHYYRCPICGKKTEDCKTDKEARVAWNMMIVEEGYEANRR